MRIVCDENMAITPMLRAAATSLTTKPGRAIVREDLLHADALLVRSVTPVTATLLENTTIQFVGTATAGIDHIDQQALQQLGIGFACAAGANANAVSEWVLGVLAYTGALRALLAGGVLGIVGFGHVGQRLHCVAKRLGIETLIYDPWFESGDKAGFTQDLRQIVDCTAVSLHAALHDRAPWPSRDLLKGVQIPVGANGRWLINAARGALLSVTTCNRFMDAGWQLCLDTWPEEPVISSELLSAVRTASAHIAGYSKPAKIRATNELVTRMQRALDIQECAGQDHHVQPLVSPESANNRPYEGDATAWLEQLLIDTSRINRDDRELRALGGNGISATTFDQLRKSYPARNELAGTLLTLPTRLETLTKWCDALEIRWLVGNSST